MLFQRVNQTDPERIFVVGQNSDATATANGQWYTWDLTTDQDGVGFDKATGVSRSAPAGVATGTIAASAYGLLQAWGYRTGVNCTSTSGGETGQYAAFVTSHASFAANVIAQTSATIVDAYFEVARPACVMIVPTNTAARKSQTTMGEWDVLICCI